MSECVFSDIVAHRADSHARTKMKFCHDTPNDTIGRRFPKGYRSAAPHPEPEVVVAEIKEMV